MTWTDKIACPFCGNKVERFVSKEEAGLRDGRGELLFGEHCDSCYRPFDVNERGEGVAPEDETSRP